jgi:hypothetical protein
MERERDSRKEEKILKLNKKCSALDLPVFLTNEKCCPCD